MQVKTKTKEKKPHNNPFRKRFFIILSLIIGATCVLIVSSFRLQYLDREFYNQKADNRHIKVQKMVSNRGSIFDRRGTPLAVSTPVDSVVINPREYLKDKEKLFLLSRILSSDSKEILKKIDKKSNKSFMYLKRHISQDQSKEINQLGDIKGLWLEKEYKRYFPAGEVTGHLIGFTNIDDRGQEGMELLLQDFLVGEDGSKLVLKDRFGNLISDIELIKNSVDGEDFYLSIDLRIQYLAHRALQKGITEFKAKAGSAVVLDVLTGEVLAMVNQPSADPNTLALREESEFFRNRSVTDRFEPGSTFKTLTVAAALEHGIFSTEKLIDTSPFSLGKYSIGNDNRCGSQQVNLETILVKSCNAGAARVAKEMEQKQFCGILMKLGFGEVTASGFPGEDDGKLGCFNDWRPTKVATVSYGYGVSVTPLQLAKAYAAIANKGVVNEISLEKIQDNPKGSRALSEVTADTLLMMLEAVVEHSVSRAKVKGYRVGGKTGTAQISSNAYSSGSYNAFFVGIAPISNPRIVTVVVVNEPQGQRYYGGQVAAPIFSSIVSGALRIMGIAPDGSAKS